MTNKIIFHSNQLSIRGTEIALYDYAFYNQQLLNNESLIAYKKDNPNNNNDVIEKFSQHFKLLPYESIHDLEKKIQASRANLFYAIKSGDPDDISPKTVPMMVHAVFPQKISAIHGAAYAFVSEWLSMHCSNNKIPFVPHIVSLPNTDENCRSTLGIPENATVFGCYGGSDSFDIKFTASAISTALAKRRDIYFVFMGIKKFISHERVLFLKPDSNLIAKVKFINTCDAMLHARKLGESFGLACAEFSIRNKPIITYKKSKQRNHIFVLGKKGIYYSNASTLEKTLIDFDRNWSKKQNWDCYSALFSPENVMPLFEKNLIQTALKNGTKHPYKADFTIIDKIICKLKLKSI